MSSLKANLYEGMIYIIYKKLQLNCLSWFHTNVSTWCRWVKTINVRREILSHNYLFLLCVLFVVFKSFKPLIFHWSFNIIGIFKKNQKNKKVSGTCHIPTMFKLLVFLFVIFKKTLSQIFDRVLSTPLNSRRFILYYLFLFSLPIVENYNYIIHIYKIG